jgi:hypothetical protein
VLLQVLDVSNNRISKVEHLQGLTCIKSIKRPSTLHASWVLLLMLDVSNDLLYPAELC